MRGSSVPSLHTCTWGHGVGAGSLASIIASGIITIIDQLCKMLLFRCLFYWLSLCWAGASPLQEDTATFPFSPFFLGRLHFLCPCSLRSSPTLRLASKRKLRRTKRKTKAECSWQAPHAAHVPIFIYERVPRHPCTTTAHG